MQLTEAMTVNSVYVELDEPYEALGLRDYIEIDDEKMVVVRGEGTTQIKVLRGRSGTAKATHNIGAIVTRLGLGGAEVLSQFVEVD